jgi:hypothetical protein
MGDTGKSRMFQIEWTWRLKGLRYVALTWPNWSEPNKLHGTPVSGLHWMMMIFASNQNVSFPLYQRQFFYVGYEVLTSVTTKHLGFNGEHFGSSSTMFRSSALPPSSASNTVTWKQTLSNKACEPSAENLIQIGLEQSLLCVSISACYCYASTLKIRAVSFLVAGKV